MSVDLNHLTVFSAVAEEQGFRAAGRRLGVSGSAVSQTISRLEDELGVALFNRTTRSVRLTEAGRRLQATVAPALSELQTVTEQVKELADEPMGTLRLNVSREAESVANGPLLAGFLWAYPEIRLEMVVTEHTGEIVAAGYDAAVGLGEVIGDDMVAVPVSDSLRMAVGGSPSYFEEHAPPRHPRDLEDHVCINWKPTAEAEPYRWEFCEDGTWFSVTGDGRVTTTEAALNVDLAKAGLGLTMNYERVLRPYVEAGELVTVLEDYCEPFPGFHLYFPRRRYRSAALQAFIDYVREEAGE